LCAAQAPLRVVAQLAALLGGDGLVFLTALPGAALRRVRVHTRAHPHA
jgi:hypothetical protein